MRPVRRGAPDRSDVDALAAARAKAEAGDRVAQFALGSISLLRDAGHGAGDRVVSQSRGAGLRAGGIPDGPVVRLRVRCRAERCHALDWYRKAAEHGIAAAQRAVGEFYKRAEAWRPTRPKPPAGFAAAPTAMTFARNTCSVRCTSTAPASRAITCRRMSGSRVAAGQTPLMTTGSSLIELRNIAAARMTPEQVCRSGSPGGVVEAYGAR